MQLKLDGGKKCMNSYIASVNSILTGLLDSRKVAVKLKNAISYRNLQSWIPLSTE